MKGSFIRSKRWAGNNDERLAGGPMNAMLLACVMAQGLTGAIGGDINDLSKTPSAEQLETLGLSVVRSPLYTDLSVVGKALEKMGPNGKVVLVLNNQTVPETDDAKIGSEAYNRRLAQAASELVEKHGGRIAGIEVWNEQDHAQGGNLDPKVFAGMLKSVYDAVQNAEERAGADVPVVVGGMASGNWDHFKQTLEALGDERPYDGVGLHPYGNPVPSVAYDPKASVYGPQKTIGELSRELAELAGKPVWLTEVGVYIGEDTGNGQVDEQMQADFYRAMIRELQELGPQVAAMWSWHAGVHDGVDHENRPFALFDREGRLRPVGEAVRQSHSRSAENRPARTRRGFANILESLGEDK